MKKFTLIELLIVVAIIGILLSILLPSLGRAREMTKRAVCLSNQRQMHIATAIYAKDNRNILPSSEPDSGSNRYLGQPGSIAYNAILSNTSIEIFSCPSFKRKDPFYYDPGKRWVWHNGSLYLGNLKTTGLSPRYVTPKYLYDEPKKALFTCKIVRSNFHNVTNFAHGRTGARKITPAVEPSISTGCEGTNVTRLDGSGRFEWKVDKYSTFSGNSSFYYFTEE
jgi:prepilin-type N-terminal cleavage/methylation domain-containing protein